MSSGKSSGQARTAIEAIGRGDADASSASAARRGPDHRRPHVGHQRREPRRRRGGSPDRWRRCVPPSCGSGPPAGRASTSSIRRRSTNLVVSRGGDGDRPAEVVGDAQAHVRRFCPGRRPIGSATWWPRARTVVGVTPEDLADLVHLRRARGPDGPRVRGAARRAGDGARRAHVAGPTSQRQVPCGIWENAVQLPHDATHRAGRRPCCARGCRSPTPAWPSAALARLLSFALSPRSSARRRRSTGLRDHRHLEVVPAVCDQGGDAPAADARRGLSSARRSGTEQDRRSTRRVGPRTFVTWTITVSTMFIPVHDPDAALAFYRDAARPRGPHDVSSDGFRWVTVCAAARTSPSCCSSRTAACRRPRATPSSRW